MFIDYGICLWRPWNSTRPSIWFIISVFLW